MEDLLNRRRYSKCSKCGSSLSPIGKGTYGCKQCGNVEYDNYGKVYHYLSNAGSASIMEISQGTGLRLSEVRHVLQNMDISSVNKPFY